MHIKLLTRRSPRPAFSIDDISIFIALVDDFIEVLEAIEAFVGFDLLSKDNMNV